MARVAVFGSLPESLINFRGPMMRAMVAAGHEVHALSPPARIELLDALSSMGVRHHVIPLSRTGLNPLTDLRTLVALSRVLRDLRVECLFAYTIKPVIYGGLAARIVGVPRYYAMVTGLGYTFSGRGLKGRLLGQVARVLYRQSLSHATSVFFQNGDNLAVFRYSGLLRDASQAQLIPGSGVDIDHFSLAPLPVEPCFLMIARLLVDKGVREYVDAARKVKARHPSVRFRLAGWIDDNPAAITKVELEKWLREGVVEFLGYLDDVRPAIAQASVYCLPSYHEGMPRTVLEAMSMGRAIITTDAPGCRETVNEGDNGFLVPVRNSTALAEAMARFIEDPGLAERMGVSSRRLAEQRFDVNAVNHRILKIMELA